MKKRILSLFLALVMLFSLLPAAIPAAAEEDLTAPTELDTVLPQEPVEDSGLAAEPAEEPEPSSEPEPEAELEPEPEPEIDSGLAEEPVMPDASPALPVPSEGRGSVVPFEAGDGKDDNTGVCGPNLTWTLLESGTLIISGSGAMSNYSGNAPWNAKRAQITAVVLDPGVTSIGSYAFSYCTNLSSVTIPDSVTSIEYGAFYFCSSLTGISLPESVTSIGGYAFDGCSRLTGITLPEGLTSIGQYAFEGCTSLTSITIPENVHSLGDGWVSGCISLSAIHVAENNLFYCSVDGVLYNKAMTTLVAVPPAAFPGEFTIPESVTTIKGRAFDSCHGLTGVTIPSGVIEIPSGSFRDCSNLTHVTIPDSVTSIKSNAFKGCSSLTYVTIPDSVTSIGSDAFSGCSSLSSIVLPEGLTTISSSTFYNCSSLNSITIPESVKTFESHAFYGCSSLTGIVIPESMTTIPSSTFMYSGLTSIVIPEGVTSIEEYAFYGCFDLKSITFPSGLEMIGKLAFCRSGLRRLMLPSGVKSIGDSAFWYCDLLSVTIPASVESIGDFAFEDCSDLVQVYFLHDTTPLELGIGVFEYDGPETWEGGLKDLRVCVPNLEYIRPELLDYDWAGDNRIVNYSLYNGEPEDPEGPDEPEEPEEPEEPVGDVGECTLWYRNTSKHFDHDLTYYVSQASSTEYNQPLAAMLSTLASAAYVDDCVGKSMAEMEFTLRAEDMHNYYGDSINAPNAVGYSFACKKADDDTTVVAVLLRGSSSTQDWQSNFDLYKSQPNIPGPHNGFKSAEMKVYRDLCQYLEGIEGGVQIVITGHSRAAAVGNLLAKHLLDSGMVLRQNLFAYNFACPDSALGTAFEWNPDGRYDGIFNISNVSDPVSAVPGALMSAISLGFTWGKSGEGPSPEFRSHSRMSP